MQRIIFVLFSLFLFANAQPLQYSLSVSHPNTHCARVSIQLPTQDRDSLFMAMPAWAPGRYVIYNFSQNVFNLSAKDESGRNLPVRIQDKQTWKILCSGSAHISLSYSVFAHTLDGTFSFIDSSGASLNGASLFLYPVHCKNIPIELTVNTPDNWQTVCALPQNASGRFLAANYDVLVDSPIESGCLFVYPFDILGTKHRLVFHQPLHSNLIHSFISDLKKVISTQASLFGSSLPYPNYTFFFHLKKDLEHPDGMEHLNSCRVLLRMDSNTILPNANTNPDYDNLIWLSAHEFFHTWNIKRLRPKGLGPFDYSKETYTPTLWIVEGLTSYYAYLSLVRSGIYTAEKLYSELAGRISRYEHDPGRFHRSLAEVSMLTWLFKGHVPTYAETNRDQTFYSYYYKGLIVGWLLDLNIRHLTQNTHSLDDVMHRMYAHFFNSPADSYYLHGKGYSESDFEKMASQIAGVDLSPFFDQTIRQITPLDYSVLNSAGLKLDKTQHSFRILPVAKPTESQIQTLQLWLSRPQTETTSGD